MVEWLLHLIKNIPEAWQIIILAAAPVTELRLSIPVAVAMGLSPAAAFSLSVVGNLIPAWFVLRLLQLFEKTLPPDSYPGRLLQTVLSRTRRKSGLVQRYGTLGLALFVAVPAPGTGVWTGCLLAFLFEIRTWSAMLAFTAGVIIAGLAVTLVTVGAFSLIANGYGLFLVVAVSACVLFLGRQIIESRNRNRHK